MTTIVFGSTSGNTKNAIDTSLFVQEPYIRRNYIDSSIGEGTDMKNKLRFRISQDPISIIEQVSKLYVDNTFNDPSTLKKHCTC